MTYKLSFYETALKEWHKLSKTIQDLLKNMLKERLENPRVPSAALSGMKDCYKIKLRSVGYRLVYRVDDDVVYVTVISIGKRERLQVYLAAMDRI